MQSLPLPMMMFAITLLTACASSPQTNLGIIVENNVDAWERYGGKNKNRPSNTKRKEVINKLLASGADINKPADEWGKTALSLCITDYIYSTQQPKDCDLEMLRFLISKGADPQKLHQYDDGSWGEGAHRHLVTFSEDKELYDFFYKDVGISEKRLIKVAGQAATFGKNFAINYFLRELDLPVDTKDEHDLALITRAARNGEVSTVKLLLELGADPLVKDPINGKSWRELLEFHAKWEADHEKEQKMKALAEAEAKAAERRKKKKFWNGVNAFIGAAAGALYESSGSPGSVGYSDQQFEQSISNTYNSTLGEIQQLENQYQTQQANEYQPAIVTTINRTPQPRGKPQAPLENRKDIVNKLKLPGYAFTCDSPNITEAYEGQCSQSDDSSLNETKKGSNGTTVNGTINNNDYLAKNTRTLNKETREGAGVSDSKEVSESHSKPNRNTRHCVSLETRRGTKCGKPDSMHIIARNNCPDTVYVKICIEGKDGKWECGSDSSFKSGTSNGGYWDCDSTGNYEWDSCTGGYGACGFKK